MKSMLRKNIFIPILSVIVLFFLCGCQSPETRELSETYKGTTVYNKVGIHSQLRGDSFLAYSTNYLEVPSFFKMNTKFQVKSVSNKKIVLLQLPEKQELTIVFVRAHNLITIKEYFNETFSKTQTNLPASITAEERKHIEKGEYEPGMSRKALFYSVGYPPAVLTKDRNADVLTYQSKRYSKVKIHFNDKDKIIKVQNRNTDSDSDD